jgi:hypothetical protein
MGQEFVAIFKLYSNTYHRGEQVEQRFYGRDY